MRHLRSAIAILSGGIAALGVAAPVAAQPLVVDQFHDSGSELWEDACGVGIIHSWDVYVAHNGVAHGDGLIHFRDSVRGSEVFTNPVTERSYTHVFAGMNHDLDVSDNGDGTLSIVAQDSGTNKWYDGDGKFVLMNSGRSRFRVLIDHNGTPTDPTDDELIEFTGDVKPHAGRNDFDNRDFCEDFIEFTS
jgi:hypothetical protein